MYYVIHHRATGDIRVYESQVCTEDVKTWCETEDLDLISHSHHPFDASIAVFPLDPLLTHTLSTEHHGTLIRGPMRRALRRWMPQLVKVDVGDGMCEGNAHVSSMQTLIEYGYTPLIMDGSSCYCAPPSSDVK